MNEVDLEEFPCDLGSVDWYKGIERFLMALRKLQNEPPYASIEAKRKNRNLMILHYTVCGLFALFALYIFYTITSSFISFLSA
ncbi:hypothetical protein WN48_09914 [Eufriesea mexicana]|uniref:Uncharacterized protein n=1 Tax=Eufriesea mexicana TaxID=516756 RepID=A0A310SA58_9HYME|nr:hypothetical protein WN48_09914 [Eufriesea mexicana]